MRYRLGVLSYPSKRRLWELTTMTFGAPHPSKVAQTGQHKITLAVNASRDQNAIVDFKSYLAKLILRPAVWTETNLSP